MSKELYWRHGTICLSEQSSCMIQNQMHWRDASESGDHPIDTTWNTLDCDHDHWSSRSTCNSTTNNSFPSLRLHVNTAGLFAFGFCCWLIYPWILLFQPRPGFHSTDLKRTLATLCSFFSVYSSFVFVLLGYIISFWPPSSLSHNSPELSHQIVRL